MPLDREFVRAHPGSGVILSPRVYRREQIERHAREILELGGLVMFDPQFYQPRTEREKILDYPYWNGVEFESGEFANGEAGSFAQRVVEYQIETLNVSEIILPGRYTNSVNEDWLATQAGFAQIVPELKLDRPVYSTISLGPDVVTNTEAFDTVLDEVVNYPVHGVYFVIQSPSFLVTNELFLYSLLDGFLSVELGGKRVLLGYGNQQSLIYAAAGVETLASGNFRNTRSFNSGIFDIPSEDEEQRRRTWYYDADTLSEYRIEALDLAYRRGLKGRFGPICNHCESLLSAQTPSSVAWREGESFRHFLHEIHRQWCQFEATERRNRLLAVRSLLEDVITKLETLVRGGFRPGTRAFDSVLDASLDALNGFAQDRSMDIARL